MAGYVNAVPAFVCFELPARPKGGGGGGCDRTPLLDFFFQRFFFFLFFLCMSARVHDNGEKYKYPQGAYGKNALIGMHWFGIRVFCEHVRRYKLLPVLQRS